MKEILRLGIAAALGVATCAQASAQAGEAVDPVAAARTFADICLAHSDSAAEARTAAAVAGFAKGTTLPGLAGGAPLEAYHKPPLELVIREKKSGSFGCLLLFAPDSANEAVAAAVTALPGVTVKSSKGSAKRWRGHWKPASAPAGSQIVLTIGSGTGERIAILTLESNAKRR